MVILSQKKAGRKQDLRKAVKPPLEIYLVSQIPKVRRQQLLEDSVSAFQNKASTSIKNWSAPDFLLH